MGYDDLIVLPDGWIARCEMLRGLVTLRDYNFDLPKLLSSDSWQNYLKSSSGCWCTHDCGIGISIMKEPALLKNLVTNLA